MNTLKVRSKFNITPSCCLILIHNISNKIHKHKTKI